MSKSLAHAKIIRERGFAMVDIKMLAIRRFVAKRSYSFVTTPIFYVNAGVTAFLVDRKFDFLTRFVTCLF